MSLFKKTTIKEMMETWDDAECLEQFCTFFPRVSISAGLVEGAEEGIYTHQIIHLMCGHSLLSSEPKPLAWPLQPIDVPDFFKGELN